MKKQLRLLLTLLLLSVVSVGWADSWVRTDYSALQTGDIVAIVDLTSSCAMPNNNGTSSAPKATAITLNADKSELAAAPAATLQWVVTVSNGSYQFGVDGTSNFLYCTNTNNGVRVGTNTNNKFTFSEGGDNNVPFMVNSATSRYIGVYNSQEWRCYTSVNANIKESVIAFYKYTAGASDKQNATVAIGANEINVGGSTTVSTDGPALTLTSSNTNVATVSGNTISGVAAGITNITATWAENDTYNGGSKTFTLSVKDADKGTESNPYTVAEALALINNLNGQTSWQVYVKGIVSGIVTAYDSQYGNISYNISDDGTTEANQLQAFRGLGLNGDKFTSENDLLAGDQVVVCGTLTMYNTTPEFAAKNYLVSLTRQGGKEAAGLAYEVTSLTKYTTDAAFTNPLTNPNGLTVSYDSSNPGVATVDANGQVTIGTAGSTTITATSAEDDTYYAGTASYTLTVKEQSSTPSNTVYRKVTATADLTDGEYLIVYEDGSLAFNGGLETLDAVSNTINVTIANDEIASNATVDAATFTIDMTAGTIKSKSGFYIGQNSNNNGLASSETTAYTHNEISINQGDPTKHAEIVSSGGAFLRYNAASNQNRFRYYKSSSYASQQAIHLYKKVTESADVTMPVTKIGYASMYYQNVNLIVPAGVKASAYVVTNGKLTESKAYNTGDIIPAGTAVVIEALTPSTETQTFEFTATTEAGEAPTANMLYGSDTEITDDEAGYKYYILSTPKDDPNGEPGFYWQQGTQGDKVTSAPNKAYLKIPADVAAGAKGFTFSGETTGITTIDGNDNADADGHWYTIDGQRLNTMPTQKGLYIHNGKKIVVK